MLGVNNAGQKWYEALATFLLILVINCLLKLPTERLPTRQEWYSSIVQGLTIALTLYAINKGIEWKKRES